MLAKAPFTSLFSLRAFMPLQQRNFGVNKRWRANKRANKARQERILRESSFNKNDGKLLVPTLS